MTDQMPLITIGMTCFNAADTIGRAIESAAAQDYPHFEILIVDDGSKDNSHDVIRAAIKDFPQARFIIHEVNTGFAGALNTIIKEAKGAFLAIFDDDDVSDPTRIRAQYERIVAYEKEFGAEKILCHVARMQTFENGLTRYEKTLGTEGGLAPHGEIVARRVLYGDLGEYGLDLVGSCANCARMGRIEIFRDLNGYDDSIRRGEDTDFSVRFALSGGHFVGIAEPLVHQYMTTGAEKTLDKEYYVERTFTEKHEADLKRWGWYGFALRWLDIRYANLHENYVKMLFLMALTFIQYPIKTIRKLIWSLPARDTRNSFKDWHLGKYNAAE
ncbi:MAG: glycosyltransferase family 2 protein [Pseudobdellovibrionaceae bacterium]